MNISSILRRRRQWEVLAALSLVACFGIVPRAHANNVGSDDTVVCAAMPPDIQQLQQAYQAAEAAANAAAEAYFAAYAEFLQLQSAWRNAVASGAPQSLIQMRANLMNPSGGSARQCPLPMAQAAAAMTAAQLALDAAMAQLGITAAKLAKCGLYGVIVAESAVVVWECSDIHSSGNTYVGNGGSGGWWGFIGATGSKYFYYCNPFR